MNIYKLLGIALMSTVLFGCVTTTPQLDSRFGESVNAAKANQIIHPDASQNLSPVNGLDGKAANSVINRYHKSYETPPAAGNVFSIGVGTGTSAGASGTTSSTGVSR